MISATVLCGCGNIEIPVESEVTSTSVNVIESETVINNIEQPTIIQEEVEYADENQGCVHNPPGESLTYHSFDYEFIKYVGESEFWKWYDNAFKISEEINSPDCRNFYVNIYNYIHDFNISKEEFEKILCDSNSYYYYDYNFDILYCDDEKIVDEYYRTEYDRISNLRMTRNELSLKSSLWQYVHTNFGEAAQENWILNKNDYNEDISIFYQWSIPEIILEFNIPRKYVEERIVNNPDNPMYSYDFDKIYSKDKSLNDMMEKANNVKDYRAIDESLRLDYNK